MASGNLKLPSENSVGLFTALTAGLLFMPAVAALATKAFGARWSTALLVGGGLLATEVLTVAVKSPPAQNTAGAEPPPV